MTVGMRSRVLHSDPGVNQQCSCISVTWRCCQPLAGDEPTTRSVSQLTGWRMKNLSGSTVFVH